jgi:hypothetical protein
MADKQYSAFITARKGFCYLTIKIGRRNFDLMRIRSYTLDAQDKRDMRRLHPDTAFDWKKISRQLAEKREACRCYRSRRRTSGTARRPHAREPLYAVYDPIARTVYADGVPTVAGAVGLLDAILSVDRTLKEAPSPLEGRSGAKPRLELVHRNGHRKTPTRQGD